ncbi:HEXXH motif domain-containing protein [Actinophytocola sp.]|uniref:HEXXH motif domain-containing protein n=1 Tax=Actinophytocola sp. TaxID=1872138 RepID=UPI002ED984D3
MAIPSDSPVFHRLSWADFDALARGKGRPSAVRRLRRAERSRRLLLLRALLDEVTKTPDLFGPLPSPEEAWDLLARVEARSPAAFDLILAHPYTGSWAGYTIRLLRNEITGTWPLWVHIGHFHALAAAAAVHARLNFRADVPLWKGMAALPSLGTVRLPAEGEWSVAKIRGSPGQVDLGNDAGSVRLPATLDSATDQWWHIRRITAQAGPHHLSVRLDDLDPYRGLYEPVPPQRLGPTELAAWQVLIDEAWQLIVDHVPALADTMPVGLDSIVPRPVVTFGNASASTGEAFGSAIIARQLDAASLAATLVHEFRHIVLGGILHLTRLHDDDPRARFYVPWRDDPRPLDRVLQGVYAFFGVTEFWRALFRADGPDSGRAALEFAYWRAQTWRALTAIRGDTSLTEAGHRFVDGVAARLEPWRAEAVPTSMAETAGALAADHHAGWRLRHLRPRPDLVARTTEAWLAGRSRPPAVDAAPDPAPTPVPDGEWSHARTDLIRLGLDPTSRTEARTAVPDATDADLAYAAGEHAAAAAGYRGELAANPDRPTALVGLGLALAARGIDPAARALLGHPELVRAVHRELRAQPHRLPSPEDLAAWIGTVAH